MNLGRLFGRRRRERELDAEIEAHLAMSVRDRIERGEDPQAAEAAARREFGNRTLVEEATRNMWSRFRPRWIESLLQDARYALRGMRRSPIFTLVAVASLALGIGANTAIFSIMYTVMLRALPVRDPGQLVELLQKYPNEPRGNGYWSRHSFEHYRDNARSFSAITGAAIDNQAGLQIGAQDLAAVVGEYVLENYFSELGLRPALGRLIGSGDDPSSGGDAVAVVSWPLWNSQFHRDPAILGKRIKVDDTAAAIIGVAPRGFNGLRIEAKTSVWLAARPKMGLALIARLKPGVTLEQARAEMALLYRFTIEERAAASTDPQIRNLRVEVEPCGAGLSSVRDRIGKPLAVLMTVVGVLLLLACVNIAGMLLARGAARAREMALRLGLGASRGRLARQMLTESLMLSAAGAIAGVGVAYFGAAALLRMLESGRPHEAVHLEISPDAAILSFAVAIAVLTGLVFGLAPAWHAFRSAPSLALRQSGLSGETRFSRLVSKSLLAAQVALAVLLLSSGALLVTHLANLKGADLGFRRDHVLLAALDPSRGGYSGERLSSAYQELLRRIEAIPGVRSASLGGPTPLHGAGASGFATAEGFAERPEDRRFVRISYVAPKYLDTLGTPLLAGRDFTFQDTANPRVAIVNRAFAQHYFAGRDPIGKKITMDHVTLSRDPATYEIIGVAGDANYYEIREPERRAIYLPAFRAARVIAHIFVIRTDVDPESIAPDVTRAVRDVAPGITVSRTRTLEDQIDASIVLERMMAALSGFFAALGALLAGIGLYGVLAYMVSRRTTEIGIRLALGATSRRVVGMVLRESLSIVAAGLALGAVMAFWGRRAAAALLQDLTSSPISSLALGAAVIVCVALIASCVPAMRAARVDPVESLRHD